MIDERGRLVYVPRPPGRWRSSIPGLPVAAALAALLVDAILGLRRR